MSQDTRPPIIPILKITPEEIIGSPLPKPIKQRVNNPLLPPPKFPNMNNRDKRKNLPKFMRLTPPSKKFPIMYKFQYPIIGSSVLLPVGEDIKLGHVVSYGTSLKYCFVYVQEVGHIYAFDIPARSYLPRFWVYRGNKDNNNNNTK